LKLVICAPILGLLGISFFVCAQVRQNQLAMRKTAPGFFLAQPAVATSSVSLP
jgi:hypothetical protein